MSKEFHRAATRDESLRLAATGFVRSLRTSPGHAALDLRAPRGAADPRARTARIDDGHRAVLFLMETASAPTWLLVAIDEPAAAERSARSLTFGINPVSNAIDVLPAASPGTAPDAGRSLPVPAPVLTALGIDARVAAAAARSGGEDGLDLASDLPEWQRQVIADLATGTPPDEVAATYRPNRPIDPDDALAAAQSPASRMQFVLLDSDEELRRTMAGDFAAWRTYLHPTQRAIAYRPSYRGSFRLNGGAGTGKTVVALHRAAFLARRSGARVLLCTFNRNLAADLRVAVAGLAGSEQLERITVLGMDQLVRQVVTEVDGQPGGLLGEYAQEALWQEALHAVEVPEEVEPLLSAAFLAGEFRSVVGGMPEPGREAYLKVKRAGRGVRLNRVQRAAVWAVFEEFQRRLAAQHRTTFEVLAGRAARIVEDPRLRPRAPTYDHVVVDEGQDLHPAHWRVLRGLVEPGPDDLFVCEDSHQRIYGERTVLSRYGIQTRGRARRLTLNYRTSRQNLAFAVEVIAGQPVVDLDGGEDSVAGYRSTFTGPVPVLRGFSDADDEARFVVEAVRGWLAAGVAASAVAVLSRRTAELDLVRRAFRMAGITVELLGKDGAVDPTAVKVASMHRAKGGEFARVVVVGAQAGVVPLGWALENQPEAEQSTLLGRERALFYVACSRAREQLVVTWTAAPSPFLPGG